ncbi:MAG: hypothetical protein WBM98_13935, partial [Maribacter sp.]|uniref:hypothetical protein n=1 Tax=Maribacter sp. TaxID=1897614 RepID=UPI003C74436D
SNLSPHWPMQVKHDMAACCCDSVNVSYEEYFDEITVPILYIGSELGGGLAGSYTSGYTASTDIANVVVTGYSHADLWFAYDANELVWNPLRNWIVNHR